MTKRGPISDIAFTPAVKAIQSAKGSRQSYARMESRGGWQNLVTPELADFIATLDMFYMGTANRRGTALHTVSGRPQRIPQGD